MLYSINEVTRKHSRPLTDSSEPNDDEDDDDEEKDKYW